MTQRRERREIAVEVADQLEMSLFFRQWRARQSVSMSGRLGRFRTADLLCVREALSH